MQHLLQRILHGSGYSETNIDGLVYKCNWAERKNIFESDLILEKACWEYHYLYVHHIRRNKVAWAFQIMHFMLSSLGGTYKQLKLFKAKEVGRCVLRFGRGGTYNCEKVKYNLGGNNGFLCAFLKQGARYETSVITHDLEIEYFLSLLFQFIFLKNFRFFLKLLLRPRLNYFLISFLFLISESILLL